MTVFRMHYQSYRYHNPFQKSCHWYRDRSLLTQSEESIPSTSLLSKGATCPRIDDPDCNICPRLIPDNTYCHKEPYAKYRYILLSNQGKNGYINKIITRIITPMPRCRFRIQKSAAKHKSLVTLHLPCRHVKQTCRSIHKLGSQSRRTQQKHHQPDQ